MLIGIIIGLFIAWTLTLIACLASGDEDVVSVVGTGVIGLTLVLISKVRYKFSLWRVNHKYYEILFWVKGEKRCRCTQLIPKKDLKKFNTDITKEYYVTVDARPQLCLPNRCDFLYEESSGWTKEGIEKYYRKDDED